MTFPELQTQNLQKSENPDQTHACRTYGNHKCPSPVVMDKAMRHQKINQN